MRFEILGSFTMYLQYEIYMYLLRSKILCIFAQHLLPVSKDTSGESYQKRDYQQIENRHNCYEENFYFWVYCYILLILYPTDNKKKKK